MSHDKIRDHIDCLNCGKIVTEKYCPNCGQENAESRKSFSYLFTHFVEDLTHYDNAFWKTIQYLLFRPSRLTREYLAGKRKKYVAPVKLYIFISFITFLLIAMFPTNVNEKIDKSEKALNKEISKTVDSINNQLLYA